MIPISLQYFTFLPVVGVKQGWVSRFRGNPAQWLKISLHVEFRRDFRAVVIKELLNPRRGNHV